MQEFPQYKNKKVLVFGLGLNDGGLGMVEFFLNQGAHVTVTDGKTEEQLAPTLEKLKEYGNRITYHLGGQIETDFIENDIIIRNPAIKPGNPLIALAERNGKQVEMEISLFMRLAPCKIIGISGTRGKSTTTTLIYKMLQKEFGDSVILAGNIGKSAIRLLPELTKENVVVLELSSFQLDMMRTNIQSPQFSLLTNIYVDHMNWHADMEDYIGCKYALFTNQNAGDTAVVNKDDERAAKAVSIPERTGAKLITFSSKNDATYQRKGTSIYEKGKELLTIDTSKLTGEHNYQNILGAIAMVRQFSVSKESILHVLQSFEGVEGREEVVRTLRGVTYVNDTTATSLEAMIAAMERFGPQYKSKIIMISGGVDKGLDYQRIAPLWEKYAKALVLLEGTASEKMAQAMEQSAIPVHKYYGVLKDAVEKASSLASEGDLVILCPGAASFNMFANEFDRGKQYNDLVAALS